MVKTVKKTARRSATPASKRRAAKKGRLGKKLVVVESPAKARTINRYLGPGYIVIASMGHVRDLPPKKMGVDVENGFKPTYEPLGGRKKILAELSKYAKSAPEVLLATDMDREGEAIAWHLAESLKLPAEKIRRVVFGEITSKAVQEAFANPGRIDMNKVNAQQARRILDRIVGYEISPLLWKKVAMGLSAGRVQSVAVRLIVERQREIDAFMPEEYWRIGAIFTPETDAADELARQWAAFEGRKDENGNPPTRNQQQQFLAERQAFRAELVKWDGKKFKTDSAETAIELTRALGVDIEDVQRSEDPQGKGPAAHRVTVVGKVSRTPPPFVIRTVTQRDSLSRPPGPFTTVSLQQQAAVQLRFSATRTMRIAQQLYEGVEIPSEGSVGLITYMRTDSRRLSAEAVGEVRSLIAEAFGREYVPEKPNAWASSQRAQGAHEAIRPTDVRRRPKDLRGALKPEQFKLYELIWNRFVACQMLPARWKVTDAEIVAEVATAAGTGRAVFKAMGRRLVFDGFMRVAGRPRNGEQILPQLQADQPVAPVRIAPKQHFTQPPPRYTEASLIKALEADGIGRPSTYAGIIQTIQDRGYAEQTDRAFRPTDLGIVVTEKLVKHFPKIFDVRFTAHMEDQLDRVEDAETDWVGVLEEFYGPFSENLSRAADQMVHAKAETQPSEYTCQTCGKPMVYRFSKNGRYLACTGYPACKTTYPVDKDGKKLEARTVDVACPKCSSPLLLRQGRFGPFLSCSRYPDCDGVVNLDKKGGIKLPAAPPLQVELTCPKCDKPLYLRRGARGPWLGCSAFPKCRGRVGFKTLKPDQRKQLELKLLNHEKQHPTPVIRKLDGTAAELGYTPQETDKKADGS